MTARRTSSISNKGDRTDSESDPNEVIFSNIEDKPKWILGLLDKEEHLESPIDINLSRTTPLTLTPLTWHHHTLPPKKVKLTNTGHTLILSAKWHQERPFLSDGPLLGNYVFSQLHFHWGRNDMEGSEHSIDGTNLPMEMHVVHFKSCYLTQEAALKEKDGIVVLAYFFKLQSNPNPAVQMLIDALKIVQKPHCSARLDTQPISFIVKKFATDYFLYWGSVTTSSCVHLIMWLISRIPMGVSIQQVDSFRTLLDLNEEPLLRNYREIQDSKNRRVFHISPSSSKFSTLLPIPREENFHYNTTDFPRPTLPSAKQGRK